MTSRSDIEQMLDRFLSEGAEQVPDRVIDAALDEIDQTSQRRVVRVPWRSREMPTFLKAVAAAAAIAVVVVVGVLLTRGPGSNTGGPGNATASPSASVSASPAASPSSSLTDTSEWVTFTSERYGYQIAYPPTWTARAATRDWELETDRLDFPTSAADHFIDEGAAFQILVTAFAADLPSDMSEDEWIAAYYEGSQVGGVDCTNAIGLLEPITIDGHPGRIAVNDPCGDAQAFVFIDSRVHVFAVWRDGQEALLDLFLSTVQFQP